MHAQVDTLDGPASMKKESGDCVLEPLLQRGSAPCDRFKHACVSYNGYVYIHGGRRDCTLGDFWRYSISLNQWEQLPCSLGAPDRLEGHSMVAYDGVLYVFGGMIDSGSNREMIPLWMFDFDSRKWFTGNTVETKDIKPRNRKGHSAVIYQSCMYIYGGYFDISGAIEEFWAFYFDAKKWSILSTRRHGLGPGPRHGHSCVTHNAAMYLFGGLKHMTEQNDFWRFDFRRHNWTSIKTSSGPPKLIGHHSIIHHGCLWVIGGGLPYRSPTSNLWKYNFNSRTWKKVSAGKENSQHAKMYHSVIGVDSKLNPGLPESRDALFNVCEKFCEEIKPYSFFHKRGMNKVASISTGDLLEMDNMNAYPPPPVLCACPFSRSEQTDERRLLASYENETFVGEIEEKDADLHGTNTQDKQDEIQDVCLMFGGKPLLSSSTISVWQLKLD
ncbi:leucine-zipper-like transcriptional regulator 1 [Pelobates cultripes]|uniref:Leucine-zipper-like transcriptional regulator 1 n=1 Tax=Pelobates cultripes TaxID=61616 RepID=A0AAD1WG75_PELCU|nr:leucine-zipper-like transcriptional regulator 1 [Pelobates cultripes]